MISTINLPKVIGLCYPVHIETVDVTYWNSRAVVKYERGKTIVVSQLYKIMAVI